MTRKEAAIVTAYTGFFIGRLEDVYKYLSDLDGYLEYREFERIST